MPHSRKKGISFALMKVGKAPLAEPVEIPLAEPVEALLAEPVEANSYPPCLRQARAAAATKIRNGVNLSINFGHTPLLIGR
jgi:hypothetical protein